MLGNQKRLLFRYLNAFYNHSELKGFAQINHNADNTGIVWISDHLVDERLVNLQGINRKLL